MERLLETLALFIDQQRVNTSGQGATKALKGVVDKMGRFEGNDITNYLKMYVCEMEVHQVFGDRMIETFDMAVVP